LGLIISTRGLSLSLLCQGSGQKDPEHPPRSLLELPSREIRRCANLRRGAQFVLKAKEKRGDDDRPLDAWSGNWR
ncbi:hypothetical protein, partial [Serratia marcescens]|uniref:hypothetical protein n=1 Tax=Serratia marcescens TaxID=615 RepID=UPI002380382A